MVEHSGGVVNTDRRRFTDDAGLFRPDSAVWQVNRETVVWLTGGGRALLLQVAHPLVAAAVAEHSRFQTDPLGRLRDTLAVSYTYLFGDTAHARQAVAGVNRRHASVVGTLPAAAGSHDAGRAYRALDPTLLLWVYLTSVDSWLVAYERFVRPLRGDERETYYAEAIGPGPLWGIPAADFPTSVAAMRAWMEARIRSGEVAVSSQARTLAQGILYPALWWLPAPLMTLGALPAVWLLPAAVRADYGLPWGPRREALMQRVAAVSRWAVPRLPAMVRDVPAARAGERRLRRSGLIRT